MSEKTQNAFQKYIIPAILAVALIGVILWAAQQKALAESYKNLAKESYVRAYGELTDDLYDMESTLSKLTAVNSPAHTFCCWTRFGGCPAPRWAICPICRCPTWTRPSSTSSW